MSASPAAAPLKQPSPLALPVIILSIFIVPLAIAGIGVTLPYIARDLGSDPLLLQSVVNGFNTSFALFTLFWGVLSDRLGYRATVIVGLAIFVAGSLLSTLAPNLPLLDLGRILAGIGGAAVFTGASALLSNAWEGAARVRNFAIFGTTIGVGSAIGSAIAGLLTGGIGWRGVFAAFGIVALLGIVFSFALPHVKHEHVPGRKVVDFTLLRNPHFLAMCLVPVAGAVGVVTLGTYLPVAYGAIYGLTAPIAGLFMLFFMLPIIVVPLIVARLLRRVPNLTAMKVIYVALGAMIAGNALLLVVQPQTPMWWAIPGMLLVGAGMGGTIGLVDGEALAAVPAHRSGAGAGVLNFMRLGSEAVAIAAFAAAIAGLIALHVSDASLAQDIASGQPGHGDDYAGALHLVLLAMIVINIVISVAIALLHRARLRGESVARDTLAHAPVDAAG